jgi:hypothetical protein
MFNGDYPPGFPVAKRFGLLPTPTSEDQVKLNADLENHVMFREAGALAGSVSFGHLLYTMDLKEMDGLFSISDKAIGLVRSKSMIPNASSRSILLVDQITRRAESRMDLLREDWRNWRETFFVEKRYEKRETVSYVDEFGSLELENQVSESSGGTNTEDLEMAREKRFIPFLPAIASAFIGGGALLGTGLGMFNTWQLSSIKGQAEDKQGKEFIIQQLQGHEGRLAHMEADLAHLNLTQLWVKNEIVEILRAGELFSLEAYLDDVHAVCRDEVDRRSRGLEALLHKGLSPLLVNSTQLTTSVSALKKKAAHQGFITPVEEAGFLYQLPASFISSKDGIVTIFVHVPLLIPNNVLAIYEFVNMPMALNGSIHSVQVDPESHLLAVNIDRDGFLILTLDQLEACDRLGQLYLCPDTNYLMKDFESYCLTSLFLHRSAAATKTCPTAIVPERIVVTQMARNEFYVFHPKTQILSIDCPQESARSNSRLEFRGARLISIPFGCFGHSKGYSISAFQDISLNFTVMSTTTSWKLSQLLHNISLPLLDALLPEPPKKKVMVEDIVSTYWAIERGQHAWPWHWGLGLSLSTTVLLIGGAALTIYCCRNRLQRSLSVLLGEGSEGVMEMRERRRGIIKPEARVYFSGGTRFPDDEVEDGTSLFEPPAYSPPSKRVSRRPQSPGQSLYAPLMAAATAVSPALLRAARSMRRASVGSMDSIKQRFRSKSKERDPEAGSSGLQVKIEKPKVKEEGFTFVST